MNLLTDVAGAGLVLHGVYEGGGIGGRHLASDLSLLQIIPFTTIRSEYFLWNLKF